MSIIIKVHARQILDSRGNPTIEVDVQLFAELINAIVLAYKNR